MKNCNALASLYGFSLTTDSPENIEANLKRFSSPSWWFSAARKLCAQKLAEVERELGIINQGKTPYSTNRAVSTRKHRKLLQQEFLESHSLQNHLGEAFTLAEVAAKNVSNPTIRRSELMTRIHGFEIAANNAGHSAVFLTLTVPSRMHSCLQKGRHNPKFDHTTPRQANDYLCGLWSRVRAKLHRKNIQPYGFRVAEPHHDGTPHWHFLLFTPGAQIERLKTIMRHYALSVDGSEKGASKHRFKSVDIDLEKGSAAGYIAKYISKNIDGEHLENDLLGNSAKQSAERIEAWASDHRIRQFQQIGGPSVTVWRELRKLKTSITNEVGEQARQAADAGNWAAYVMAMGGIHVKSADRPIKPVYEHIKAVDVDTGELVELIQSKYGDARQKPIRGLSVEGNVVLTRNFVWSPDRRLRPLETEEFAPALDEVQSVANSSGASGTWTCVNNCTETSVLMN